MGGYVLLVVTIVLALALLAAYLFENRVEREKRWVKVTYKGHSQMPMRLLDPASDYLAPSITVHLLEFKIDDVTASAYVDSRVYDGVEVGGRVLIEYYVGRLTGWTHVERVLQ